METKSGNLRRLTRLSGLADVFVGSYTQEPLESLFQIDHVHLSTDPVVQCSDSGQSRGWLRGRTVSDDDQDLDMASGDLHSCVLIYGSCISLSGSSLFKRHFKGGGHWANKKARVGDHSMLGATIRGKHPSMHTHGYSTC